MLGTASSLGLTPQAINCRPSGASRNNSVTREGATLVEVLVAIFVMAIGLLALLALFPLGILRMAQAIQDGRTAQTAANAEELAILKGIRYDPNARNDSLGNNLFITPDPNNAALPPVDLDGPSLPVLVDPVGYYSGSLLSAWLAGDANTNTQRAVPPTFISSAATPFDSALRWFSLLDDVAYNVDGTDDSSNITYGGTTRLIGSTVEREITYSFAYLLQRPRAGDASVVNLSVIVFKGRSVSLSGDLTLSESAYHSTAASGTTATFNTTNNTIVFDYASASSQPPPLRAGDWVLDCTPVYYKVDTARTRSVSVGTPFTGLAPGETQYRTAHGNFYRVVGVTETSSTQTEVEVETPLRGFPANASTQGVAVVIDGVVDVIDKGPGRQP